MEKKKYDRAEISVNEFDTKDVITTSAIVPDDEDDLEVLPE